MITIVDSNNTDLVESPPEDRIVRGTRTGILYRVRATVSESDTSLPTRSISGTLDWNDGKSVDSFSGTNSVAVDYQRVLAPGTYLIRLSARNYVLPTPDTRVVSFAVQVLPGLTTGTPPLVIYGPILPRDAGFPSSKDWQFDSSSDLYVLESSAKMLLGTQVGERVMEPTYGTNIRTFLFDPNTEAMETLIQQEIVDALAKWEPRLSLSSLTIQRDANRRNVTVQCALISKLSGKGFEVPLFFTS